MKCISMRAFNKVFTFSIVIVLLLNLFRLNSFALTNDVAGINSTDIYFIKNIDTGNYLDVYYGLDNDGQNVTTHPYLGNNNQKWKITLYSGSQYYLYAQCSSTGKVLTKNGTNICIWSNTLPSSQRFTIIREFSSPSCKGTYYIKIGNYYMVEDPATREVYMSLTPSGTNHLWSLERASNGYAHIYSFSYLFYSSTGNNNNFINYFTSLGYNPVSSFVNVSAAHAYTYLYYDNIWVFRGHGVYYGGNPAATIAFKDSSGNYNGYLTANSDLFGSTDDRAIDSLPANTLANRKIVLYIGCSTGVTYYANNTSYNLVSSTFNKGAHFALGTTQEIYPIDGNSWCKYFEEKAAEGGKTIEECLNYAQYNEDDLGALYYEGDVHQTLGH